VTDWRRTKNQNQHIARSPGTSGASGAPGKATGDSDIVEARFIDIVPDERVVQAVGFVSDPARQC
jgi:hypothetical protein